MIRADLLAPLLLAAVSALILMGVI